MKATKSAVTSEEKAERRYLGRWMAYLCGFIIALLPFHAFLTVWGASLVGFYTELRLWKEFLLLILGLGGAGLLWYYRRNLPEIRSLSRRPLITLAGGYVALCIVAGLIAYATGAVNARALAYGLVLDVRFVAFFGLVWLVSLHSRWIVKNWRQLVLVPAAIVVGFGLLQLSVLPDDFLRHFGYGPDTIAAVQTVDEKDAYRRIQSTLRGANPLGTYLILVLSAVGGLLLSKRDYRQRYAVLFAAGSVLLLFTFSRSAWIGAAAALGWLLYGALQSGHMRRTLLVAAAAAIVAFAGVGYALRDNDLFQNTIFHTDEHSQSAASSNNGHFVATIGGLGDIVRQPLGGGTGTAGPASVYNDRRPPRIAENYYVQVGQETGLVGLGLFIAFNIVVARELWRRRGTTLAVILLASLIGISVVNLLSHAWTDDTISYIWWGLAGAAMTLPLLKQDAKHT